MKSVDKLIFVLKFVCLFLFSFNSVFSQAERVFSDTLKIDSLIISLENSDYLVDTIVAIISLPDNQPIEKFLFHKALQIIEIEEKNLINRRVVVFYKILPIKRETFRRNYPQIRKDTLTQKITTQVTRMPSKSITDEIFGSRIERSGSISRGFSFGSNKDFTINSGLRLQLAGQLSDNLEVVAVLSDQSSPIQPEGNTRTLQEIDKVFIEIKHRYAQAVFGDFQYIQKVGTFGVVDKKLQGLKASAFFDAKNSAVISYASARGKFKSQQFTGIDGVQGPYRLTGQNNERDIIVLAGTEKVFINGEEKTRGENYDYTIDYSTGEIYFTPKIVITNASRIRVDFEYSDRKFERNFFGSNVGSSLFSDRLIFGFSYMRESDNQDLPIDVTLSENDKKILAESGSDRLKASKSGVRFVGYDTLGRPAGTYVLRDTLINNQIYQFYEFAPGSDSAFYNVAFSYIGEGKGDYVRRGLGRYLFVGPGNGNYMPLILLPMPELKQAGNFYSKFFVTKNFFIEGELSISSFDKNRFSPIDDNRNRGKAYTYALGIDTLEIRVFEPINGKLSANFYERKIEADYSPLSRIFEVEYERNWNFTTLALGAEEITREAQFSFFREKFNSQLSIGRMKRGNDFQTNRVSYAINTEIIRNLNMSYSSSNLSTKSSGFNSAYRKHFFGINYNQRNFKPFIKVEFENKLDRSLQDSLLPASFKFYDFSTGVFTGFIRYIDLNSVIIFRQDYYPLRNRLIREANNYIYQLSLNLKNVQDLNSAFDFSFRQKKYSGEFKEIGRLDNQSIALKYLGRGFFFRRFLQSDVYYEASSQRSARLERIFLRVPKGSGQYIYKGDLNNNGIADEFEFEPSRFEGDYILTTHPTDELFPVIDLKASLRLRIDFRNFYFVEKAQKILKPISSETYLRVEENSQDKNEANVYLIRIKTFQNPLTTIRGSNLIQQDINLFEYNPDFNILLRLIERRGFSKFSLTDERRFQQEKLVRLRFKPLKEFANQSEINLSRNNLYSSSYSLRNFLIKNVSLSSKIFYYPYSNVETSFKLELGRSIDFYPMPNTELNSNSQEFSLAIMFSLRGKISLSIERTEMLVNRNQNYIPFELTKGYLPGKNYIWRLSADYQFGGAIQTNFIYDGRVQGKNMPIHTATAEIRAYF